MHPSFTSLLGNLWFKSLCVWVFDTYPHDPTGIIYARQSYLGATSPKNCGAKMLDCNHFVIFNLCLYGNSLNQTPISPRLETITSLASALPGRPIVKTSITTQNSDAVRSTTEVLRTAFCLPSFRRGGKLPGEPSRAASLVASLRDESARGLVWAMNLRGWFGW